MFTEEREETLIILEFANNHMGDQDLFNSMVDDFAQVAADYPQLRFAIKLQYRDVATFIHPDYRNGKHSGVVRFESTKVTIDEWSSRINYALSKGFLIGCTPFDEVSVDEVLKDERFSFLKIGSCSFDDWPLLERIRQSVQKQPAPTHVIASTGGMPLAIVDRVVSFLEKSPSIQLALMHCIAEYPSTIGNQNLSWIRTLSRRYQKDIGFSTHELGSEERSGAYAYCMGAKIFEKHVVSSEANTVNAYSADPTQVRRWLDGILDAMEYVGTETNRIENLAIENRFLNGFRRGVFVRLDCCEGTLSNEDVYMAFPRSDGQLTANEWSRFSKYSLQEPLSSDEPVTYESIKSEDIRSKVDEIQMFCRDLLRRAQINLQASARLEISHHYGLARFEEVGLVMITLINLEYCKKLILLKAGQFHPKQYHERKRETFVVLYGELKVDLDGAISYLNPGQVVTINPGIVHSFAAVSDCVVEEISTTHESSDSYYIDETIMKNEDRKSFVSLFG